MPNTRTKSLCLDDLNDRERLEYRLEWEGYTEIKMKSDGNCQFRALADQLYKTSDCHKLVRQEIIKQLKSHPKNYKGFVNNMDFSEYVKNMSNNSVWGDEVTLKAAADVYGVKIVLITSMKRTTFIEIFPKSQNEPGRVIYLGYLAGIHFNSIHKNEGSDTPPIELQGKKNKETNKEKEKENKKKNNKKEEKEKEKETKKKEKKEKMEKKEKEEMEKEEKDKKEREEKEERDKTEETEEKNKKKLHRHFNFSDVMSILELQEDDLFW